MDGLPRPLYDPRPVPSARLMTPQPAPWPALAPVDRGYYFSHVGEAYDALDPRAAALDCARRVLERAYRELGQMLECETRHRLPETTFARTVAEMMAGLLDVDADTAKHVLERQEEAADWVSDPAQKRDLARRLAL
jgi:hypothetical protein